MSDQADQLRELVRQRAAAALAAEPSLVVVAGARRGVGCTTVAIELSIALSELSSKTIFVDADLERGDASHRMLSIEAGTVGLADVLAGRRTASEVLRAGPRGLRVLSHTRGATNQMHVSQAARDRLAAELRRLGERAGAVVMDTVGGLTPWSDRFWQMARQVVVVTTPDDSVVTATYALLQVAHAAGLLAPIRLVVNRSPSPDVADDVHQRLGQAMFRQWGELLPALPALPSSDATLPLKHAGIPLARAVMAELTADDRQDGGTMFDNRRGGRSSSLSRHGATTLCTASGTHTLPGEKIKL